MNSEIVCDKFVCDKPAKENCRPIRTANECCPTYQCDVDGETTTEEPLRSSTMFKPTPSSYDQDRGNETTTPVDEDDKWSCRFNDHLFKQGEEIDPRIHLKDELQGGFNCYETCYCKNDTKQPVIECYQITCEDVQIPKDKNCTKVKEEGDCCEKLKCDSGKFK